jgi:BirA family biotin operon repressor/biotin-[acetyl-CoA-carboxylase] ligase
VRVAGTGVDSAASPVFSRQERFSRVTSTNDVARDWLAAGVPEVCLAIADEQTAGRGREGRAWVAPAGAALLLSLGFRPTWLAPEYVWRLPAIVSVAMAEAAETVAGLPEGRIQLKWPNDLVIDIGAAASIAWRNVDTGGVVRGFDVRKLGGVLGESVGLGTDDPRVVVGIGINVNWGHDAFPVNLAPTMTSLLDASGGRSVDLDELLDAFLARLEPRIAELRIGLFDATDWTARQMTTGHLIELHQPDGTVDVVRALGVNTISGALVIEGQGSRREVRVGEIDHVRFPIAGAGV